MKKFCILTAYLILLSIDIFAQQPADTLFLRLVLPAKDTTKVGARLRIAGCTSPSTKAYINGTEVKVYPTGAFIGLVNNSVGSNMLRVSAVSARGDSAVKQFVLLRSEPMKTSPRDPVVIDTMLREPSQDRWLGRGDVLEVKFKGSPGYEASFDIPGVESGIPMTEFIPKDTAAVGGIYFGRYVVKEGDEARDVPIRFRLRKSFWSSEKIYSKGKVSILPKELPRAAEVKGRRPFLNAGLGEDRLGGAKLGFIPSGVRVTVTGKFDDQYRVQLSDAMIAWLPEDFAQLMPLDAPLPQSLVGNITVTGSQSEDIVSIALNQKLPFTSEQLVSPNAVVVNIFGATSNTNWVTKYLSSEGIEYVKWSQVAAGQYQLTVALKHLQQWGYDIGYDGTTMKIKIRRPPVIINPDSVLVGLKIAVDAGHGGESEGATGSTGAFEKDINLSIAQHLADILKKRGAQVTMTRETDINPSMGERMEKIVGSGANVLVSIHNNSTGDASDAELAKGTSTYYRYPGFKPLADILYKKMLELGLPEFGTTGSFNFSLNGPTQLVNALVEGAFMSNPEDEMKLLDDGFRTKIGEKVADGIEEFVRRSAATAK